MQKLILEPRDIRAGRIPHETFRRYAGHPLTFLSLDAFPQWEKILAGIPLTEADRYDRHIAVCKVLSQRTPWSLRRLSNQVNTWFVSATRVASIFPCRRYSVLPQSKPSRYFDEVIRYGYDEEATLTQISRFRHRDQQYFAFPVLREGEVDFWNMNVAGESLLLLDNTENAKSYWTKILGIPHDRVVNFPRDDKHLLYADAHELRHLRQIDAGSQLNVMPYYCEADSDFFAGQHFEQLGIGKETRKAMRYLRYFHMLRSSSLYWIGPLLDCLDAKITPPEFREVHKATREIHVRLGLMFENKPHKHLTSTQLQHAIATLQSHLANPCTDEKLLQSVQSAKSTYDSDCKELMSSKPEVIFSLLRQMIENGSFERGLSRTIAERIVAAANYFNPALTCEPNPKSAIALRPSLTHAPYHDVHPQSDIC